MITGTNTSSTWPGGNADAADRLEVAKVLGCRLPCAHGFLPVSGVAAPETAFSQRISHSA